VPDIPNVGQTWMALNDFDCSHLMSLHFKGLIQTKRQNSDLVAFDDMWSGTTAGLFLQLWIPHGARLGEGWVIYT